jgi:plasmid maintenance system antidote protein VapI
MRIRNGEFVSFEEVARLVGQTTDYLVEVMSEKAALPFDMASELSAIYGVPASEWR